MTVSIASIDAGFVGGRDEPKVLQDGVDVTLPETRGFGVTLVGSSNREDVSVWYRGVSEVCSPPVLKDMVDPREEGLRRWGASAKALLTSAPPMRLLSMALRADNRRNLVCSTQEA
jgi:hypothetical protein